MKKKAKSKTVAMGTDTYGIGALAHLQKAMVANQAVMESLTNRLVKDVSAGKSLFVFGSGHAGLVPLEFYHRAGGASFVIPVVGDFLLPTAGPPVVRVLERTSGVALSLLRRAAPKKGECLWIVSQSGINAAGIDVALEARRLGLHTVAFTSLVHSRSVASRHPSQKRLFEVCDETVDLGGFVGDASVRISADVQAGPLSNLTAIFLGHSILVAASARLEKKGRRCVYTSVNTPDGEARNRKLEEIASVRDPLLR